jgi:putative hydrolase of the HAD superfamily
VGTWQAVVFDLDDTLYPERDYVLSGFRAVASLAEARLGIPAGEGFARLRGLFEDGVRGDTFDRWLAAAGVSDRRLVGEMVEVYRGHDPVLEPSPGVPELLASLRRRCRLGLVSDGPLPVQQRKLAALKLAPYLDAVVFSDRWGREAWKPSTRPFEAVLGELGADAGAAVYVGDNPTKDFLGARRVGMGTVWLRQGGGEYAHLSPPSDRHAPDHTVPSVSALADFFAGEGC